MKELPCRCGVSKKSFRWDIGPFFIGECCEAAGYDARGNKAGDPPSEKIVDVPVTLSTTAPVYPPKVAGRGKLMDTTVAELKSIAKARGIEITEGMNKKAIVDALLK